MIESGILKTNKNKILRGWADCVKKNEEEKLERKDKQGAIGGVRLK